MSLWEIYLNQADCNHNASIVNEGYIYGVDGDIAYESKEENIFGVDD